MLFLMFLTFVVYCILGLLMCIWILIDMVGGDQPIEDVLGRWYSIRWKRYVSFTFLWPIIIPAALLKKIKANEKIKPLFDWLNEEID